MNEMGAGGFNVSFPVSQCRCELSASASVECRPILTPGGPASPPYVCLRVLCIVHFRSIHLTHLAPCFLIFGQSPYESMPCVSVRPYE